MLNFGLRYISVILKNSSIIFVRNSKFLISTVEFNYAKILVEYGYNVTIFCKDYYSEYDNIIIDNVKIENFRSNKNITYYLRIFWRFFNYRKKEKVIVVVSAYYLVFILPLANRNMNWVYLLITGDVSQRGRKLKNYILKLSAEFYSNKITNSLELSNYLFGKYMNFKYVPIGGMKLFDAEYLPFLNPSIKFNFVYVGTFYGRKIENILRAIKEIAIDYPKVRLILIGHGLPQREIEKEIKHLNIEKYVSFKGFIPFEHLGNIFMNSHVGIAYIPIVNEYYYQPVTKTLEYLINGLPVLASRVLENQKVITKHNGVLIDDSVNALIQGMKYMIANYSNYNRKSIQENSLKYGWTYSVKDYLLKILENI